MGQRSQIYIARPSGNGEDKELMALYFQWNYGSRMVSRARGLVEWLDEYKEYLDQPTVLTSLRRIAETNFDLRDVTLSDDIIEECQEFLCKDDEPVLGNVLRTIFEMQDNNDGKLFIDLAKDGSLKYAFTEYDISKPLTAEEYMKEYADEEEDGSNLSKNIKYLKDKENLTLMTDEELTDFINTHYVNVCGLTKSLSFTKKLDDEGKSLIASIKDCDWEFQNVSSLRTGNMIIYNLMDGENKKATAYITFFKLNPEKPCIRLDFKDSDNYISDFAICPEGDKDIYNAFNKRADIARQIAKAAEKIHHKERIEREE